MVLKFHNIYILKDDYQTLAVITMKKFAYSMMISHVLQNDCSFVGVVSVNFTSLITW